MTSDQPPTSKKAASFQESHRHTYVTVVLLKTWELTGGKIKNQASEDRLNIQLATQPGVH